MSLIFLFIIKFGKCFRANLKFKMFQYLLKAHISCFFFCFAILENSKYISGHSQVSFAHHIQFSCHLNADQSIQSIKNFLPYLLMYQGFMETVKFCNFIPNFYVLAKLQRAKQRSKSCNL